jgi:hypothetical protein
MLAAPLLILLGTIGCSSTPLSQALAPEFARNDPDAHLEFWHALPERKAVSNDEAFHAVLLFVDGEDASADYGQRVQALKDRGMLSDGFAEAPASPVRRGTLAVALSHALDIKGGLTMRVFGPSGRYATRELQYAGVYPPSSPQQTFSGAEFLGIIGRAEDYQRVRAGDVLEEPEPLVDESAAAGDVGGGA